MCSSLKSGKNELDLHLKNCNSQSNLLFSRLKIVLFDYLGNWYNSSNFLLLINTYQVIFIKI